MQSILNKLGQVSRNTPTPQTTWPHFDLIYVHENALALAINHTSNVTIEENRAILLYPGTTFLGSSAGRQITTISVHHFSIPQDMLAKLPLKLRKVFFARQPYMKFQNAEIIKNDIQRLLKLEYKKSEPEYKFMLDSLLAFTIACLIDNSEREKLSPLADVMKPVDEYIRKNINKPLTPAILAKQAGYSTNYFRVLFTDFFQMTPGKYIAMSKMKEAARLLSETLLPIKSIAQKVGFQQPSNFHRSFVQAYHATPREYRKNNHLAG